MDESVGALASSETRESTIEVALVVPLHGPAGMFGPSCELCARLAVEELNARDGILSRQVRLAVVDGSRPPQRVADEVGALVAAGVIDAVVGWHLSSVRRAVAARIGGTVPYVYTALYEGGERTPGVFLAGETPSSQLRPAMSWLRAQHGTRRWYIVGNDYIWPRATARAARDYASMCGGRILDEVFVPLGTKHFRGTVNRISRARPDAVLMLLVGEDAAHFNRDFARADLTGSVRRLSTLMDENILLASGAEATQGICATAAYFETLSTPESLDFGLRYTRRFGIDAPRLNSLGESCYEGILMLAALAEHAGTLAVGPLCRTSESVRFDSPRGELRVRNRHVDQRVYLAEASELEFSLVAQL